jgi:Uncharacterized conserved protein
MAPQCRVVDLLVDLPEYNPRASAYLLDAYARGFPEGTIFFCVVDPGVGSFADDPVMLRLDNRWYIGADNGLFDVIARRSGNIESRKITWFPEKPSASFHGRDLYAPVCAMLENGMSVPGVDIEWRDRHGWPDDLNEIVYIDNFGNCITGYRAGQVTAGKILTADGHAIQHAHTFASVPAGQVFWYGNSNGLVEIAANRGNAAQVLGLGIGSKFIFNETLKSPEWTYAKHP